MSGTTASVLSAVAIVLCGKLEGSRGAGPLNGPSQWFLGRDAAYEQRLSARHTLLGYAIHHVASFGWALLFERWRARRRGTAASCTAAASTAALACLVDYPLTPQRLGPGFEVQLSKASMLAVYAAFAAGLALAACRRR